MIYKNVTFDVKRHVAILTVNRPKALNALNVSTLKEMKTVINEVDKNPEIRALIITGSGERAFIAGADIHAMTKFNNEEVKSFADLGHRVMNLIELLPKPVFAAVNGFALGGGLEVALACDMIYASTNAQFGLPEVKLGIIPGFGGTQRLPRMIGYHLAKELIFTGNIISAERAMEIGLVNDVYEPTELFERVFDLANKMEMVSSLAVSRAKKTVHDGYQVSLEKGTELELKAFTSLFGTSDQKEGMSAFLEKRDPKFSGKISGQSLIVR